MYIHILYESVDKVPCDRVIYLQPSLHPNNIHVMLMYIDKVYVYVYICIYQLMECQRMQPR